MRRTAPARWALTFAIVLLARVTIDAGQPGLDPYDEDLTLDAFVQSVERSIVATDLALWVDLLSPNADRAAATEFFESMVPQGVTHAVVRVRDRSPLLGALPGEGYQLLAEIFMETGARGRLSTWRLDVRRPRDVTERQPWRIIAQEKLAAIEGLHRLSLHPGKQFSATNLVLRSIDLELRLASGDVFIAETAEGMTGLVLMGDGQMVFTPAPGEERGQLRLFAGAETLDTPFTAAYVRLNPYEFEHHRIDESLTPVPLDVRSFRRAQAIFDEEVSKSFSVDLVEFSADTWSLLPQLGDFLAEVRTRRFATLTYARSTGEAEDVSLFHRARKKNIAAYASEMKLTSRGRFYNEDDLVEYDVLDYEIDAAFNPDREWLDAQARLRLRVKAVALGALTLRLAEDFRVTSVTSRELGRLLFLRVRNQNSIVVNLPSPVARDLELTLVVAYEGRVQPQAIDDESAALQGGISPQRLDDMPIVSAERNWLFSNRTHWYPQATVSDYATATMRIVVPVGYTAVASGMLFDTPRMVAPAAPGQPARAMFVFETRQPVRYLGLIVSRFARVDQATVALDIVPPPAPARAAGPRTSSAPAIPPIGTRNTVHLAVEANRRQEQRGRDLMGDAADILRLYASIVGDVPYDGMTMAMVEHHLPGGHSPGYFAVINNPLPVTPFVWRNDPAAFGNFPEFFVAHEIAHQWWGQAVGWKNYHEQWLSEGFAQYFAALYAHERRGDAAFRDIVRQFRRWALEHSDQGAVYLGYRLGHIKGDSRVFRSIVYNKGAAVLHMLRRLVGDEAFFRGLRRFYAENRFRKAGTEDLQRAMELESGLPLERFFERWIHESGVPRIRYSTAIDGQEAVVRFEQVTAVGDGPLYDLPVTVSFNYGDRTAEEVVAITESTVERRFPLTGALRGIDVNVDGAALAHFERR